MPLLVVLSGLLTGLGLIVVIGAQNAFVLRVGIVERPRAVAAVVAVCALSDLVLIAAGVVGIGALVTAVPLLLTVLRFAGAALLIGYGLLAARRAYRPSALSPSTLSASTPNPSGADTPVGSSRDANSGGPGTPDSGLRATPSRTRLATEIVPRIRWRALLVPALAFTWLNPHVYLDTLVLLGSVANQQGTDGRWWFAAGAGLASCLWFAALGFAGRLLRPVFARPTAWRVLDAVIAVVMIGFGLRLAILG